jgi:hypothetical protein
MRAAYFLWGALVIAGGVSLFLLKYKVQGLEEQLVASQQQVVRDRVAIRVLEAEWTYLNDPERLRRLSAEHLGFGPATARNIVDISTLPIRAESEGVVPATQPTIPLAPRRPELEAKASPDEPTGFTSVLFARLRSLLFPGTAGAATPPHQRAKVAR